VSVLYDHWGMWTAQGRCAEWKWNFLGENGGQLSSNLCLCLGRKDSERKDTRISLNWLLVNGERRKFRRISAVHDTRWRGAGWWFIIRRGRRGVARERMCWPCEGGDEHERAENRWVLDSSMPLKMCYGIYCGALTGGMLRACFDAICRRTQRAERSRLL